MDAYVHSPYLLESKLIGAISVGNTELAESILKEINLRERAKLAPEVVRSNKNSVIASITLFTRAAITAGVIDEDAYTISDQLINEVEASKSLQEINELEYKALHIISKNVRNFLSNQYNGIALRAMQVIKSDLKSKLTLSIIASKINVTPVYLSELFRKETGKSISKYIIEAKINESVSYLKNSNYSIAEIADMYNFSSVSYYIKHFRAIFNLTPGSYRAAKP